MTTREIMTRAEKRGDAGDDNPPAVVRNRRSRRRRPGRAAAVAAACCSAALAPSSPTRTLVVAISAKSGKAAKSSKLSSEFGPKSGKIYYDPQLYVGRSSSSGGGGAHPPPDDDVGGESAAAADDRSSPASSSSSPRYGSSPRPAGCVDVARYRSVYDGVLSIASRISDPAESSHFYGGILRLVAHDFMDHDSNSIDDPMGSDGCLDWQSPKNAGLSSIWHEGSELYRMWAEGYADLSWGDFWIIAANGVVYETSVDGMKLDLIDTFLWGRDDRGSCPGSADRLPSSEGCRQVEGVFLERMGLTWRDAVALLGAHTLGQGHATFSGHHGTWVPNEEEARRFDRRYFQELVSRSWSPRVVSASPPKSDFTTGEIGDPQPKMMLNTDACLVYDIEAVGGRCCTRTDLFWTTGESHCQTLEDVQCPAYGEGHPRLEAGEAVAEMLGGGDDANFYGAFRAAWFKATTNGHADLIPIQERC